MIVMTQSLLLLAMGLLLFGVSLSVFFDPLKEKVGNLRILSAWSGLLLIFGVLLLVGSDVGVFSGPIYLSDFLGEWFFPRRFVLGWAFDETRATLVVYWAILLAVAVSVVFEERPKGLSAIVLFGYTIQGLAMTAFILSSTYWATLLSLSLYVLGRFFTPRLERGRDSSRVLLGLLFFLVAGWMWTLTGANLVFLESSVIHLARTQWLALFLFLAGIAVSIRIFPVSAFSDLAEEGREERSSFFFDELLLTGLIVLFYQRLLEVVRTPESLALIFYGLLIFAVISLLHVIRCPNPVRRLELGTGALLLLSVAGGELLSSDWVYTRLELSVPALMSLYLLARDKKDVAREQLSGGAFTFFRILAVSLLLGLPLLSGGALWVRGLSGESSLYVRSFFAFCSVGFAAFALSFLRRLTRDAKGSFLDLKGLFRQLVLASLCIIPFHRHVVLEGDWTWLSIPWALGAFVLFVLTRWEWRDSRGEDDAPSVLGAASWLLKRAYASAAAVGLRTESLVRMSGVSLEKVLQWSFVVVRRGDGVIEQWSISIRRGFLKVVDFVMLRVQNGDSQRYLAMGVGIVTVVLFGVWLKF